MNRVERFKKDQFLIRNYAKLGPQECAVKLNTSIGVIYDRAKRLRKKGFKVTVRGKKIVLRQMILSVYGVIATKDIALKVGVANGYVNSVAADLGISFWAHQDHYTLRQLACLIGQTSKVVVAWAKRGLPVKYKLSSRGPHKMKLVDIDDVRAFLRKQPEILAGLSSEVLYLLDLKGLKKIVEKLVLCKKCESSFWVKMGLVHPRCPQCGRIVSKYGLEYK